MPLSTDILADNGNPVLELIAVSCSANAFVEDKVSDQDIERISDKRRKGAKREKRTAVALYRYYELRHNRSPLTTDNMIENAALVGTTFPVTLF